MNVLLLNQDWFRTELEAAGHTVRTCGLAAHMDFRLQVPLVHIDHILSVGLNGFAPDVVVILDNSAPIIIEGLDTIDIPTVFYSIDVHHHFDFHRYLAQIFDHVLVAQKDYIPQFQKDGIEPEWMPLWAPYHLQPSSEKEYGAVFVGTLDRRLNRDRVEFFDQLGKRVPVLVKQGSYQAVFPKSRIVINQTVKGDLNFRVFEALMSGAMLLTEETGNGLLELFEDGRHLITYPKNDVTAAAERIEEFLAEPSRASAIAAEGRAEVLQRHCAMHRAERLMEILGGITRQRRTQRRFPWMVNFWTLSRRLASIDTGLSKQALIIALRAVETGIREGEPMTQELAIHTTHACCRYDWLTQGEGGVRLLQKLVEAYPEQNIFQIALIRDSLNKGLREEATYRALRLAHFEPAKTFRMAEEVMQSLLAVDEGEMWEMALPGPDPSDRE